MSKENELVLCLLRKHVERVINTGAMPDPEQGFVLPITQATREALLMPEWLCYISRGIAETSPRYLQLIPYNVLIVGGLIAAYRRGEQGEEERLHGKYSIGIGGHVSLSDVIIDTRDERMNAVDVEFTLQEAIERELTEEVIMPAFEGVRRPALIYDGRDEVGQVHLGLLNIFYIPEKFAGSLKPRDASVTSLALMPLENLQDMASKGELEGWSQLVVDFLTEHGLGQPEPREVKRPNIVTLRGDA